MVSTFLLVFGAAFVVASIMEIVKYQKYNNEITKKQANIWAIIFTLIIAPVIYFGFTLPGTPVAMLFYALVIYPVQEKMDMDFVRPLFKKVIERKINTL